MARSAYSSSSSASSSSTTAASLNPLRALAMLAGAKPIEVLVTGFCIVTLAYFQLLHAVKHSEFLQPSSSPSYASLFRQDASASSEMSRSDSIHAISHHQESNTPTTAITLLRNDKGEWSELPSNAAELADPALHTLVLQKIIVGLDSLMPMDEDDDRNLLVYPAHSSAPVLSSGDANHSRRPSSHHSKSKTGRREVPATASPATLSDPQVQASLKQFENHVKVANYAGHSFQEICYRPSTSSENQCFTVSFPAETSPSTAATILSLGLDASHPDAVAWQQAVASSSPITDAKGYTYLPVSASSSRRHGQEGLGLSFSAFPPTDKLSSANSQDNVEESRSIKWMLYAGRAFLMRFYALAKVRLFHMSDRPGRWVMVPCENGAGSDQC